MNPFPSSLTVMRYSYNVIWLFPPFSHSAQSLPHPLILSFFPPTFLSVLLSPPFSLSLSSLLPRFHCRSFIVYLIFLSPSFIHLFHLVSHFNSPSLRSLTISPPPTWLPLPSHLSSCHFLEEGGKIAGVAGGRGRVGDGTGERKWGQL